jgi:hypothetical protein
MFTLEDVRTIFIDNISSLIFIAVIAGYKWLARPMQELRQKQDEAGYKFVTQLVELMLIDSDVARVVYAKAQHELSVSNFIYVLAFCMFILSQLFRMSHEVFVYSLITSLPSVLAAVVLAWFAVRRGMKAELYLWATRIYERKKGIPNPP